MATITGVATCLDQRVVLHGVSWETYQALLASDAVAARVGPHDV